MVVWWEEAGGLLPSRHWVFQRKSYKVMQIFLNFWSLIRHHGKAEDTMRLVASQASAHILRCAACSILNGRAFVWSSQVQERVLSRS